MPLRDRDHVEDFQFFQPARKLLQLQARGVRQGDIADDQRNVEAAPHDDVKVAVLRGVGALDGYADARSKRDLEAVEPRRVRPVAHPFGAPRRGRVVEPRASGHPWLECDRCVLFAVDVVSHHQRPLALGVAGGPKVVHDAGVPSTNLVREQRLLGRPEPTAAQACPEG